MADISKAINDLWFEIVVTLFIMSMFLALGWLLREWSLRKQIEIIKKQHGGKKNEEVAQQEFNVNFWQGISTELFGVVATTIAFGILLLVFQQYQDIQDRKEELIQQMGSPNNLFASEAVRILTMENWLYDGSLRNALLDNADLQGVNLWRGDLQGVFLMSSNLQHAGLNDSNLTNATMIDTDLRGANLRGSNLLSVSFDNALFDENTLLPDAKITSRTTVGTDETSGLYTYEFDKYWNHQTDMARYTDPNHPDFWDPCIQVDPSPWYCD